MEIKKTIPILLFLMILLSFSVIGTISENNYLYEYDSSFIILATPNTANTNIETGYSSTYSETNSFNSIVNGTILCDSSTYGTGNAYIMGNSKISLLDENFSKRQEKGIAPVHHSGALINFDGSGFLYNSLVLPSSEGNMITIYNLTPNHIEFYNNFSITGEPTKIIPFWINKERWVGATYSSSGIFYIFNQSGIISSKAVGSGTITDSNSFILSSDMDDNELNDLCAFDSVQHRIYCIDENLNVIGNFSLGTIINPTTLGGMMVADIDGGNQELILTGYATFGSDNLPRMVAYDIDGTLEESYLGASGCGATCVYGDVSSPVSGTSTLWYDEHTSDKYCFFSTMYYSTGRLAELVCINNDFDVVSYDYSNNNYIDTFKDNGKKLWSFDLYSDGITDIYIEGWGIVTTGSDTNLMFTDTSTSRMQSKGKHSAMCDLDGNNVAEFIMYYDSDVTVWENVYSDTLGVMEIVSDTGNPTCLDNEINYTISYSDTNSDEYSVGVTCNNGEEKYITWKDTEVIGSLTCTMESMGDYVNEFIWISKGSPLIINYVNKTGSVTNDTTCYAGGNGGETVGETNCVDTFEICSINSDCCSGFCRVNFCDLGTSGEGCTSDSDCVSGECKNSLCTKESLGEGLLNGAEGLGVKDSLSKNIVSLLIIVFSVVAILRASKGSKWGVFVALGIYLSLTIFCTFIGWLNPIFIIGTLVTLLAIIFFMISNRE